MQQEIRFKVVMDDAGVPGAAGRTEAALTRVGAAGRSAGGQMGELGKASKLTGQQLTALSQQTSDIAVSLAGGQNPFMVLLQQGTQLRDQFGGTTNVLKAYASVLSPARLLTGGLAASVAALGVAAYQGYQQVDALTRALAVNGNAAGVTRGEIDAMAARLADMPGASIGPARAALYQLAGTGTFVSGNLELAGRAAQALGRLTGESAEEAAKAFDGMRNGVAQWAATANKSYNFLTAETYRYIRSLEAQGKGQEAIKVALEAMATTMESRAAPALGYLQIAIEKVKSAGSGFWDWLLNVGRPETPEETIAKAQEQLGKLERRLADAKNSPVRTAGLGVLEREAEAQRQVIAAAQETLRMQRRTAEQQAATAAKNQREIEESSGAHSGRMLGLQAAEADQRLALQRTADEAETRALEDKHRYWLISGERFNTDMRAVLQRGANAEVQAAEAAVARAKAQPAGSREEVLGRQVAVIQAETKVIEARAKRDKLLADINAGKYDAKPREVFDDPREAFRRGELTAGTREADQLISSLRERSRQGVLDLVENNRAASIELIRDDRARGLATIANDERVMRERMGLAWLSVDERQQAEETLAQWRVMREQQLTEQLKPQWKRNAELWADTTRYMKQSYDDFLTGFVDRGRSAFEQFLQTGKLSTSTLTSFIRQEFARMAYERFLASSVQQLGNWLFNAFLGAPSGGGSGMPDDVPTRGGKAFGGSVAPQSAWVVGERGPEVLVMGRSGGTVVPNHALASGGGQSVVINQHFAIQGNEDDAKLYALAALAKESAVAAVADARRRGNPAFS